MCNCTWTKTRYVQLHMAYVQLHIALFGLCAIAHSLCVIAYCIFWPMCNCTLHFFGVRDFETSFHPASTHTPFHPFKSPSPIPSPHSPPPSPMLLHHPLSTIPPSPPPILLPNPPYVPHAYPAHWPQIAMRPPQQKCFFFMGGG